MKPHNIYPKLFLLSALFLFAKTGYSQSNSSTQGIIGTWYCIEIDCPFQTRQFEITATRDLKVQRTYEFEVPGYEQRLDTGFYSQIIGGIASSGGWRIRGNSLVLTEGATHAQQQFTFDRVEGQPFLVLTSVNDKCKWYLVTITKKLL